MNTAIVPIIMLGLLLFMKNLLGKKYNSIVSSKEFENAMKIEKLAGAGGTLFGAGVMGAGLIGGLKSGTVAAGLSAKGTLLSGAGLLAHGLNRYNGSNRNKMIKDISDTITPPVSAFENLR